MTQQNLTIKGKVLNEIKLQVTGNGRPFTKFDLGINGTHPALGIPVVTNIHVATWTDLAEYVDEYCKTGDTLELTGRFETRPYTDRSGNEREWTEFIAYEVKKGGVKLTNIGFVRQDGSVEPDMTAGEITPSWEGAPNGDNTTGEDQAFSPAEPQEQATSQE